MQKRTYTASKNNIRQVCENLFPIFTPLTAMHGSVSRCMVTGIRPLKNFFETRRIHYHDFLEIGYCISGSGLYYIRDDIYPIGPGDIVIVYPGENHDGCNIDADSSTWRFLFAVPDILFDGMPDREHLLQLSDMPRCRGAFVQSRGKETDTAFAAADL